MNSHFSGLPREDIIVIIAVIIAAVTHKGKYQRCGHFPRFWKAWAVKDDSRSQHQPFCSQKPGFRCSSLDSTLPFAPAQRKSNITTTHTCQPAIQLQQCPHRWAHLRGESTQLCYCTVSLQLYLTTHKTDASLSCCTRAAKWNGSQQPILATKFFITPAQILVFVFQWAGKWKT